MPKASASRTFNVSTVVHALAVAGDWKAILTFYDKRPADYRNLCTAPPSFTPSLVLALRHAGRNGDADSLLACFQQSISAQMRMTYRYSNDFAGSLEVMQAAALALRGDRRGLDWLRRAVSLGWMGQDWSPDLRQWPEFDQVRTDPRMNLIQQSIAVRYQQQRSLAQKEPTPGAS